MNAQIITTNNYDPHLVTQSNLFLEHISKTKSVATLRTYTNKISVFVNWWHTHPLETGLKSHLESFKGYINERYTSARSKNLVLSVVRNLFRHLYEEGVLKENHAAHLKNFKVGDGHSKSALDRYQLERVFDHLREATGAYAKRNRALVALAVANGLRANEIANIELEDITYQDGDRVIYLLRKGYTDKSCYTILNPNTAMLLDALIGERTEGYLFQSQRGEGLNADSISKISKSIFRACGIDDKGITQHSLRHTFAKLALEANVNITQIMTALNHKHLSSTQVYARAYDRHKKSAEKAINVDF